jgi:hypothetical protein
VHGVAASFGYSADRLALATLRYSKGAVNLLHLSYSYAAGLRVKKVAGGTTTRYIFSGTKVIAEYVNGALSKEYIYSSCSRPI